MSQGQLNLDFLVRRTLDDLYWPMSYSRWRDERYWPAFRDAVLREHAEVTTSALEAAREYNAKRYHYQGIGRYEPDQVYARGIGDLRVVADLLGDSGFVFGPQPATIDAAIYGFIANIWFFPIQTPLRRFLAETPNLVRHCDRMHAAIR